MPMLYRAKIVTCDVELPYDPEYLAEVQDILEHPSVLQMQEYMQHGTTTCLAHSINVSYFTYLYSKKHGLDARSAARGGLLHDLFLYDWHSQRREKGELLHGFEHPKKALKNAENLFSLNDKEKNIILRHMWPLTMVPPRYTEAYIVVWFDKYCSLMETLGLPVIQLFEYAQMETASKAARKALSQMPFPLQSAPQQA